MSAVNPDAIRVTAMKFYIGPTDPGDGAVIPLVSGVPATGTFLGGTDGPANINIPVEYVEQFVEQETSMVAVTVDVERMSVETPAKEFSIANLDHMMPQGETITGVGTPVGKGRFVGGNTTVTPVSVLGVAPLRTDPSKFIQVYLPKAVQRNGLSTAFSRSAAAVTTLKWEGMADLTKSAGRKLGYVYISD